MAARICRPTSARPAFASSAPHCRGPGSHRSRPAASAQRDRNLWLFRHAPPTPGMCAFACSSRSHHSAHSWRLANSKTCPTAPQGPFSSTCSLFPHGALLPGRYRLPALGHAKKEEINDGTPVPPPACHRLQGPAPQFTAVGEPQRIGPQGKVGGHSLASDAEWCGPLAAHPPQRRQPLDPGQGGRDIEQSTPQGDGKFFAAGEAAVRVFRQRPLQGRAHAVGQVGQVAPHRGRFCSRCNFSSSSALAW